MDVASMEQGEKQEDAQLQQILELCKSGNPAALGQIAQIVEGMLGAQQEEEAAIEGSEGGEGQTTLRDKMLEAVKNRMA